MLLLLPTIFLFKRATVWDLNVEGDVCTWNGTISCDKKAEEVESISFPLLGLQLG
jgi:hypothetical protein